MRFKTPAGGGCGLTRDPVRADLNGAPRPVLVHAEVRYVGQPIATVVVDIPASLPMWGTSLMWTSSLRGTDDVLTATPPNTPPFSKNWDPTSDDIRTVDVYAGTT